MSSKSPFRRAAQLTPAQRREQLLTCAVHAFAQNGIGRANHAQVAKLAGVAVPTVFAYFPNRESLVDAVLEEIERLLLGIVRQDMDDHSITAFQKLLNLLSSYVEAIDSYPEMVKVFLDWTTSFEDSLASKFQVYLDKLVVLLSVIIEEGRSKQEFGPDVNPRDAALMIYSSANVLAQIRFHQVDIDAKHYIINLIASVLHLNPNEEGGTSGTHFENQQALTQWPREVDRGKEGGRRRATSTKWALHVDGWQRSGQTQSAYCKENNISPSTFSYWVKKLAVDSGA